MLKTHSPLFCGNLISRRLHATRYRKNKTLAAIISTTMYVMKGKEGELIPYRRSTFKNNYFEVTL